MNSKDKNINKNQQKGGYYLEGFVAFIVLIIITFLTGYLYEFDINNVTQMFYTKLEEENEANRIKQIKDSKNTEQSVSTNIEYKIPSRSQDPNEKPSGSQDPIEKPSGSKDQIATPSIIEKIITTYYKNSLELFNNICDDKSLLPQEEKDFFKKTWQKAKKEFRKDSEFVLSEDFKNNPNDKEVNNLKSKYKNTLELNDSKELIEEIYKIRNSTTEEKDFCEISTENTKEYAINLIADYLSIPSSESSSNKNDLLFSLLIESSKKVVNSASTEKVETMNQKIVSIYSSFKDNLSKKILDCDTSDDLSKSLWIIIRNKSVVDFKDYIEHLRYIRDMLFRSFRPTQLIEKETKIKNLQSKYTETLKEIIGDLKEIDPKKNLKKIIQIINSIPSRCDKSKNVTNLINDLFDDSIIEYLRGFDCIRNGIESLQDEDILNAFDSFVKSVNRLSLEDFLEGDLLKNTSLPFQLIIDRVIRSNRRLEAKKKNIERIINALSNIKSFLNCGKKIDINNHYENLMKDFFQYFKKYSSKSSSNKKDLLFSSNNNNLLLSLLIESSKNAVKIVSVSKDIPPSESSSNNNDLLLSLLIESSKNAVKSMNVYEGDPSNESSSNKNDLLLSLLIESSKKV